MALPGKRIGGTARREAEARARASRKGPEPGPGPDHPARDEKDSKRQARIEVRVQRQEERKRKKRQDTEAKEVRRLERKVRGATFWAYLEPIPKHPRRIPKAQAVLVLVLNTFPFPGLGTVLYGKWERGLAQFLLTFLFLIGWVWAITDGIVIVKNAFRPVPEQPTPMR